MNIENMTPEQVQLIMMSGEDDPAFQEAKNKQRIADQLRQQGSSPIEGKMIGQYYHPGTLADVAVKGMQGYQSRQMQGQAEGMQRQAQGRVVQGRQAYGNAMIEALRKRTMASQTPPQSMAGPADEMDYGPHASQGGY